MIQISAFTLPSDPACTIRMREATVADCISLADINESREEAATTMFLNAVCGQDSARWTADDRRFALLWYYVHTERDHLYRIEYECPCGQTHVFAFDLKDALDTYQAIDGKPERKIQVRGEELTVVPLTGAAMEALELERIGLSGKSDDSPEARKARLQIRLNELIHRVRLDGFEKRITEMSVGHIKELMEAVALAGEEMAHGLDTVYEDGCVYLLAPAHQCPNTKEVTTRCRVRFRAYDLIPQL
jgi:hypothetical protein